MQHVLALVLLLFVGPLLGQGWVDRTGPNGPAPRYGHAMCYDPGHGYTLMVGNSYPLVGGTTPDTWSWDGTAWTNRGSAPSNMRCLVWHAATSQLVGMATSTSGSTTTWTISSWNGAAWISVDSITETNWYSNVGTSGAYDGFRQESAFRPTATGPGSSACVFVFNGTTLQKRFTTSGPDNTPTYWSSQGINGSESMAWDPLAQKILLARDDFYWSLLGSTWVQIPVVRFYEWSGSGWNIRYPATAPGRCGPMATDVSHQRVIMLDAEAPWMQTPGANQPNHTWAIGNGLCANLTTSIGPIPRRESAMAFDPVRGVCVLFGGYLNGPTLADTWEFDLGPLASFTPYGTGCVGSRGVPSLTAQGTSTPRLGTTFIAQINGLPWTGPAFLFVGLSDTSYGGTPLPFNLNVLGAQGCNLLTSCEQIHLLTNVLGSAQWSFPVPPFPGASFYTQVFPLDPVNALGLTASNGGRGVIGL